MVITVDQIKGILPLAKDGDIASLYPFLQKYLPQYGIDTAGRIGAFFAQIGEESNNLHATREYASGADYEGRADLGNTQPGDGVKFKGRGLIQITGRNMYQECSLALFGNSCLMVSPSILESPDGAVKSACWFWADVKHLNDIADLPDTWVHSGPHQYNKFQWITIEINGGLNGYAERLSNYERAKTVLNF